MQQTALRLLKERGIDVIVDANVIAIEESESGEGEVVCEDGKRVPFCEVIWCTNVSYCSHCGAAIRNDVAAYVCRPRRLNG